MLRAHLQVKSNKEACFEPERRETHVQGLVSGLIASVNNELLSGALIEAVAALVAEPEAQSTPDAILTCAHQAPLRHTACVVLTRRVQVLLHLRWPTLALVGNAQTLIMVHCAASRTIYMQAGQAAPRQERPSALPLDGVAVGARERGGDGDRARDAEHLGGGRLADSRRRAAGGYHCEAPHHGDEAGFGAEERCAAEQCWQALQCSVCVHASGDWTRWPLGE